MNEDIDVLQCFHSIFIGLREIGLGQWHSDFVLVHHPGPTTRYSVLSVFSPFSSVLLIW